MTDISKKDIFNVHGEFFSRMPFQAIKCRLAGVLPPEGGRWTREAGDTLWEGTLEEGTSCPLPLQCTAISQDQEGRFSVILVSGAENLAEILISQNLSWPEMTSETDREEERKPELSEEKLEASRQILG